MSQAERGVPMPSCMQRVGTPNSRHNKDKKYREKLENVDPSLTQYNEIIREKSVEQIYDEKVQPAFEAFNERQKRKDRRLDVKWNCTDALGYQRAIDKHAQQSKNKIDQKGRPPIRELILQYGNPEQGFGCANQTKESRELAKTLLLEAQMEIEKSYPNLAFGDVVFHADEVSLDADDKLCGSFHLHADFVSLCYENKQGPDVQVAFERSLREMGFPSFEAWKHDLDRIMETVLERHGLERTIMGNTEVHQESRQWHRQQRAIKETKELEAKRDALQQEVGDLQEDAEIARNEVAINQELAAVYREEADQANDEMLLVTGDLQQTTKKLQELDAQLQEKNLDYHKAVSEEIEGRMEKLPEQIERKAVPMSRDKVIVSAQDLDELERRSGYVAAAKETEASANARAAGIISQAEAQAAEIQKEAAAAAERMKLAQQQAWGDIDAEKERLRQRSQRLEADEARVFQNADKIRNYEQLQTRVKSLETALNVQLGNRGDIVEKAVERATQPLKEQLQEKDKEISLLKSTVSSLQIKLQDVAQTAAELISAIKYVAERFAGKISGAILNTAARIGERWMVGDGFTQHGNREAALPKAIARELQLDLEYKIKGSQGKGVYTKNGDLIANVESYQNARERFPACTINREKDKNAARG